MAGCLQDFTGWKFGERSARREMTFGFFDRVYKIYRMGLFLKCIRFASIMMSMNVTLKEFPVELHGRLKSIAEESGRSLNRQIIHTLQIATMPTRSDERDLMERIRNNRAKMSGRLTQAILDEAIREGRP